MVRLHGAQRRGRPMERYVRPTSLQGALTVLAEAGTRAKAVAGGTDLLVESLRGQCPEVDTIVDLSVLDGLGTLDVADGRVRLGPLVTHSDVVGSEPMRDAALPLAQACLEVGSPQLRNRATVVGNLVTASPSNDTISALYALNASVTTANADGGTRTIPVTEFVTGYRSTALAQGELVTRIAFDALHGNRRGIFVKAGLRRHQAISVVHAAIAVTTAGNGEQRRAQGRAGNGERCPRGSTGDLGCGRGPTCEHSSGTVEDMVVALGSVGPTVMLVEAVAEIARGRRLDDLDLHRDVAAAARTSAEPIDDLRSTAEYRSRLVEVLVLRALRSLAVGTEASEWPARPPLLAIGDAASATPEPGTASVGTEPPAAGTTDAAADAAVITDEDRITATVNGVERSAANSASRTLLDWLRLELGLTGSKEGCAEGECGACTVHLNGRAVLACLTPAARADGAEVATVEGVAPQSGLHSVQQALADTGGVQCGFCTPGFVMSAAMLAEENPNPSRAQVEHALSGNLCRCTGYYPIIAAVTAASGSTGARGFEGGESRRPPASVGAGLR